MREGEDASPQKALNPLVTEGPLTADDAGASGFSLRRVQSWLAQSPNRRVLAAGLSVAIFSGVVQVLSLGKEVMVARTFGTGDQLDAFFIAFVLPSFAINVLGWSLNSALVPGFVTVRERDGTDAAHDLLRGVSARILALLLFVTAMLAVVFPLVLPLIASRFNPAKLQLTLELFLILLPFLALSAVAIIWGGVLNAYDKFTIAAAAPGLVPVAIGAALVLGGAHLGVKSIAIGIVAGTALQCAVLARALSRIGVPLLPRWGKLTPAVRDVFRQYAPAMGGAVLTSSTAIVDQSMSAMLPSGSVSTFNYGTKLVSAALGIGMLAIGTAVLPHFSRLAARGDYAALEGALRRYAKVLIGVTVPATLALVLVSVPVVRVMFERGAFLPADTLRVAHVQQLFALQVPFYLVGILVVRLISALRRNNILLWGAAANVILNVGFNLLFMKRFGVAGIALSTTLVYVFAASGLGLVLLFQLRRLRAPFTVS